MGFLSKTILNLNYYASVPSKSKQYDLKDEGSQFLADFKIDNIQLEPEIRLPEIADFELSTILENNLQFELQQLIESLTITSRNYRIDLSNLINRILNYQNEEVFKSLETLDRHMKTNQKRIKMVDNKIKKDCNALLQDGMINPKVEHDLDEIIKLTSLSSDIVIGLVDGLKELEKKVLVHDKERLAHNESINRFQYPLLSKLMMNNDSDEEEEEDSDSTTDQNSSEEEQNPTTNDDRQSIISIKDTKAEAINSSLHLLDINDKYFKSPMLDTNSKMSENVMGDNKEKIPESFGMSEFPLLKGIDLFSSVLSVDNSRSFLRFDSFDASNRSDANTVNIADSFKMSNFEEMASEAPDSVNQINEKKGNNLNNKEFQLLENDTSTVTNETERSNNGFVIENIIDKNTEQDEPKEKPQEKPQEKLEEMSKGKPQEEPEEKFENDYKEKSGKKVQKKSEELIGSNKHHQQTLSPQEQADEIESLLDKRVIAKQNKLKESKYDGKSPFIDNIFNDEDNKEFDKIKQDNHIDLNDSDIEHPVNPFASPSKSGTTNGLFLNKIRTSRSVDNVRSASSIITSFSSPRPSGLTAVSTADASISKFTAAKPFISHNLNADEVLHSIQRKDDERKRSMSGVDPLRVPTEENAHEEAVVED